MTPERQIHEQWHEMSDNLRASRVAFTQQEHQRKHSANFPKEQT
jgi:hypothetical protein